MVPYAKRMEKMAFTANVVKGLFGSMTNPDIISFSGGSPAREALPVDTIRQLADEVLRTDTRGGRPCSTAPLRGSGTCGRWWSGNCWLPRASTAAWTTS